MLCTIGNKSPLCQPCVTMAVTRLTMMCVHEHMETVEMCQEHLRRFRAGEPIGCADCWLAGHDCPLDVPPKR